MLLDCRIEQEGIWEVFLDLFLNGSILPGYAQRLCWNMAKYYHFAFRQFRMSWMCNIKICMTDNAKYQVKYCFQSPRRSKPGSNSFRNCSCLDLAPWPCAKICRCKNGYLPDDFEEPPTPNSLMLNTYTIRFRLHLSPPIKPLPKPRLPSQLPLRPS